MKILILSIVDTVAFLLMYRHLRRRHTKNYSKRMKLLLFIPLISINLNAPPTPKTTTPILESLHTRITAAVIYHGSPYVLSQYSYLDTPAEIAALNSIQGIPGQWDGYNSNTPFDQFTYPYHGDMVTAISLEDGTGYHHQIWAWRQISQYPSAISQTDLLVWVFSDMAVTCAADGTHCGNHHFKYYYVDIAAWEAALGIQL